MEQQELQQLERLAPGNPELKALWDEHILFKKQLETFEQKSFLTPTEEQEVRQLKKQKLDCKTKLVNALAQLSKKEG